MADTFVSHVEEDADIALEIAVGLEEAGYATWCYEVDSIPGPSYLIQTGQAVEIAKAIVVVISPNSLGSRQVTGEVIRAHESNTRFIPILRGITHAEFQSRQPEWREAIGAAASTSLPPEGVSSILPRIITGLGSLGITPSPGPDAEKVRQLRRVLDNIQEYGSPEKPGEPSVLADIPEVETGTSAAAPAETGKKTKKWKKWLKRVAIGVPATIVVLILLSIIFGGMGPDEDGSFEGELDDLGPSAFDNAEIDRQDDPGFSQSPSEDDRLDSPILSQNSPDDETGDSPDETPEPSATVIEPEKPVVQPTVVNIPDSNLKAFFSQALGKPSSEDLTDADLAGITNIYAERLNISDLTGIEYCINLVEIILGWNQITDLSPLASLPKLTQLEMWGNQISDISPLASMTSLSRLDLGENQITDISALASLPNLAVLELSMNLISDISPLAGKITLVDLDLNGNLISNIGPLADLTRLARLNLGGNQISNVSALESLSNLVLLEMSDTLVSDVSGLSTLTNLTMLDLRFNRIRSVAPLASLTNLTALDLDGNQLKNIGPLAELVNLNALGLRWNQITDILPLVDNAGLSQYDTVYLGGNNLSTTSMNQYIPQLTERGVEVVMEEFID